MNTLRAMTILACVAAGVLGGCVDPGPIDATVVNRYQESLVARPQQRADQGLSLLAPPGTEGIPALSTEETVPRKLHVETDVVYKDTGQVDEKGRRLEVVTTVRTTGTTFQRDPTTGQETVLKSRSDTTVERSFEYVPPDSKAPKVSPVITDTEDRVGRDSWTRSIVVDRGVLIHLTLEDAITRALANNAEIRVVSYDPAIARQDVIKAAAEFDWTVFGGASYARAHNEVDPASFQPGLQKLATFNAGIKEMTITGAQQSLAWTMTRNWDNTIFHSFSPQWQDQLQYQLDQPLLRDAWPEFNLSKLKIAQLNQKISAAQFRQKVEEIINDTISTYWSLVEARADLQIQEALLAKTQETYWYIVQRQPIDASQVQIKQAEAAVESRKAVLIRARKTIHDVQDKLARQLSDKQINLLSAYEIIPETAPATAEVKLDVTDQLLTGLRFNPVLEQARQAIDVAAVNVTVARNQELPKLNFQLTAGIQGLDKFAEEASESMTSFEFASYSVGLQFEYPLGNRERRAEVLKQRYGYLKAIAQLQDAADQVGVLIKERIRQVETTYQEMHAQEAVIAAAKAQLQALEDTQQIRGRLSPEFLQVKLQAQESLADAHRSRWQAIVAYNSAMADLARATGTVLELQRVHIAMPAVISGSDWPSEADLPKLIPATRPASAPAATAAASGK
ncbi:MAG: TolC family protein [Phycisphaerae bacterium]